MHARVVMQCIDVQELSHQQNQDVQGQLARLSAVLQIRGAMQVEFCFACPCAVLQTASSCRREAMLPSCGP